MSFLAAFGKHDYLAVPYHHPTRSHSFRLVYVVCITTSTISNFHFHPEAWLALVDEKVSTTKLHAEPQETFPAWFSHKLELQSIAVGASVNNYIFE